MGQIDRTGTFRGVDTNRGIGESTGGHIQWIADLVATEYYDEDTQQWIDWSEYDVNEIRCWLMLFDKDTSKKPYLNSKQLQKAGRWSGLSFQELKQDPPENLLFQFRVEPNDYKDDGSFKVTWVDHYDAEPGRAMNALDDDAIKKVDAKYAAKLRNLSGGPKPKGVPQKPTMPPKPAIPTPAPAVDKESAKAAMKAEMEEKAARGKVAETKAKRGRPPKSKPEAPKTTAPAPVETCTLEVAWETVYAAKPEAMSDDDLGTRWLEIIDKYGDQDTLSPAEWAVVRDEVVAEIEIPF